MYFTQGTPSLIINNQNTKRREVRFIDSIQRPRPSSLLPREEILTVGGEILDSRSNPNSSVSRRRSIEQSNGEGTTPVVKYLDSVPLTQKS